MVAFIIGFIVAFWFMFRVSGSLNPKKYVEPCEKHIWTYDIKNELYCSKCNRRPG